MDEIITIKLYKKERNRENFKLRKTTTKIQILFRHKPHEFLRRSLRVLERAKIGN